MEHSPEEIKHHVKIYISVFAALAVLTVVTVTISYMRLAALPALVAAIAIATIKASLVAAFFMHLISEKKIIYTILAFAVLFFFVLLIWPSLP